ncbi:MAG: acyltransferase [Chloroflexi bacterium]|nr:acyltransferase [Chloroflexota bacterium]
MSEQATAIADSHVRIPALDGVRGIAILMVLLSHGFYLTNAGRSNALDSFVSRATQVGWEGVELFFVLSGFLITRILLDAKGGRYFTPFYARRVLRIIPVYYGFMFFLMYLLPLWPGLRDNADLAQLREHQWWYWSFLFSTKIALYPLTDWGSFASGHLWSLMVEEQFYLVWPLVVLALPRRGLLAACGFCILAAPLLRLAMLSGVDPRLNNGFAPYILMPARMDALAIGAAIAVLARDEAALSRLRAWIFPAVAVSAGVLVVLAARYHGLLTFDRWTQVVGYSAAGVLCAAFVTANVTAAPGSVLARACGHRTLAFFGRYSYALYVFHYQIFYELDRRIEIRTVAGFDTPARLLFTIGASAIAVTAAWGSWHLIESQALKLKRFFPYGSARPGPSAQPIPTAEPLPSAE